jgi:hypothetical protein
LRGKINADTKGENNWNNTTDSIPDSLRGAGRKEDEVLQQGQGPL